MASSSHIEALKASTSQHLDELYAHLEEMKNRFEAKQMTVFYFFVVKRMLKCFKHLVSTMEHSHVDPTIDLISNFTVHLRSGLHDLEKPLQFLHTVKSEKVEDVEKVEKPRKGKRKRSEVDDNYELDSTSKGKFVDIPSHGRIKLGCDELYHSILHGNKYRQASTNSRREGPKQRKPKKDQTVEDVKKKQTEKFDRKRGRAPASRWSFSSKILKTEEKKDKKEKKICVKIEPGVELAKNVKRETCITKEVVPLTAVTAVTTDSVAATQIGAIPTDGDELSDFSVFAENSEPSSLVHLSSPPPLISASAQPPITGQVTEVTEVTEVAEVTNQMVNDAEEFLRAEESLIAAGIYLT